MVLNLNRGCFMSTFKLNWDQQIRFVHNYYNVHLQNAVKDIGSKTPKDLQKLQTDNTVYDYLKQIDLPHIEKDPKRKVKWEKKTLYDALGDLATSNFSIIQLDHVRIKYPVKHKVRMDETVARSAPKEMFPVQTFFNYTKGTITIEYLREQGLLPEDEVERIVEQLIARYEENIIIRNEEITRHNNQFTFQLTRFMNTLKYKTLKQKK